MSLPISNNSYSATKVGVYRNNDKLRSIPDRIERIDKMCFKHPLFEKIKDYLIAEVFTKVSNANFKPKKNNLSIKKEDGKDIVYREYIAEDYNRSDIFYTWIQGTDNNKLVNQTLNICICTGCPLTYYKFHFYISNNKISFDYQINKSDKESDGYSGSALRFELIGCDVDSEICRFTLEQNIELMLEFTKIVHIYKHTEAIFNMAFDSVNFVLKQQKF